MEEVEQFDDISIDDLAEGVPCYPNFDVTASMLGCRVTGELAPLRPPLV